VVVGVLLRSAWFWFGFGCAVPVSKHRDCWC